MGGSRSLQGIIIEKLAVVGEFYPLLFEKGGKEKK